MAFRHRTLPRHPFQQNCSWCGTRTRALLIDPGGDVAKLLAP